MSAVYARVPHASNDHGGSIMARPEWSIADSSGAHGRQVSRRGMYTGQDPNRGGIEAANSVALRAVLWHCQILPQRGEGISGGDSARHYEESSPQRACPGESSYGRSRKHPEAAPEQAKRNCLSGDECGTRAHGRCCGPCGSNASARPQLQNGRRGSAPRFAVRGIQCASAESI